MLLCHTCCASLRCALLSCGVCYAAESLLLLLSLFLLCCRTCWSSRCTSWWLLSWRRLVRPSLPRVGPHHHHQVCLLSVCTEQYTVRIWLVPSCLQEFQPT